MDNNAKKRTDGTSKNNWQTPQWLWERLHEAFNFEVDGASDGTDNLLPDFHTKNTNNSVRDFDYINKKVFVNPPFDELSKFSKDQKDEKWLQIAEKYYDCMRFLCFIVPFAPETRHFQNWVWPFAKIFVFNRRINYVDPATKKEKKGVAFPSCLAVYSRDPIDKKLLKDLGVWVKII